MKIVDAHAHFGVGDGIPRCGESLEAFLEQSDKVGCTYLIQSTCISLAARPSFENLDEICKDFYERSGGRVFSFIV